MSTDQAALTGVLTGTVRGGAGPVPGAVVTLTDAYGTQVGRARTDAAGRFGLADVPAGRSVVVAHHPGFRPGAAAVSGAGAVELALEPLAVVHGTVRDAESGHPVAAATLVAVDAAGEVVARTISDPDGRYLLEGVGEGGPLTVVASAPGVPPAAVATREPGAAVDLSLRTLGTLTGTVRGPAGPVAGLALQLVDAGGRTLATATTDEAGRYAFADVPPGEHTVHSVLAPTRTAAVGPHATTCDLRE
jgi:uncharacterized protein YfaS (alpha-2-macroglobulin family)